MPSSRVSKIKTSRADSKYTSNFIVSKHNFTQPMVNFSEIAEIYSAALSTNGVQIWFTMLQGHCLVQQLVHFI